MQTATKASKVKRQRQPHVPKKKVKIVEHHNDFVFLDEFIANVIERPEEFVRPTYKEGSTLDRAVLHATKAMFDTCKREEPNGVSFGPLQQLLVDGFDTEQIWEQINMQTQAVTEYLDKKFESLTQSEESGVESSDSPMEIDNEELEGEFDDDDSALDEEMGDEEMELEENLEEEEEEEEEDIDDEVEAPAELPDDGKEHFFSMADMERFVEEGEEYDRRLRSDVSAPKRSDEDDEALELEDLEQGPEEAENEEDYGEADEGDARNAKYDDFFDPLVEGGNDNGGEDEFTYITHPEQVEIEPEDEQDINEAVAEDTPTAQKPQKQQAEDKPKSAYERKMEKMRERIRELERQNIGDKPWFLTGEVSTRNRPFNSLLEVKLDFEQATKAPPIVTPEYTQSLEDVIKKRITDGSWDDVIRKRDVFKDKTAPKRRQLVEISQEKSEKSLAQIYEEQYQAQVEAAQRQFDSSSANPSAAAALAAGVNPAGEKPETAEQREIRRLFAQLCYKLDSLSHFHYTPKPRLDEAAVVRPNVPALAAEEVIPIGVSTASLLAPEQIYARQTSARQMKADDERTSTERKAERRATKTAKQKAKRAKEAERKALERLSAGEGKPQSRAQALAALKAARSKNVVIASDSAKASTSYTNSTAFFKKLQSEASATVQSYKNQGVVSTETGARSASASIKL